MQLKHLFSPVKRCIQPYEKQAELPISCQKNTQPEQSGSRPKKPWLRMWLTPKVGSYQLRKGILSQSPNSSIFGNRPVHFVDACMSYQDEQPRTFVYTPSHGTGCY